MGDHFNGMDPDWLRDRGIRIHPLWLAFIKFCEELRYGEIEKLKIQDGLPLSAEEVKKKIKFSGKQD